MALIILVMAALIGRVACPAYAEANLILPRYESAERSRNIAIGVGIGSASVAVGSSIGYAQSENTNEGNLLVTTALLSGIVAVFSPFYVSDATAEMRKWETLTETQNRYSRREIEAIVNKRIFVGMSEDALVYSWGRPSKINRSSYGSDQWVYSTQYVYVDNGRVDGWN